MSAVDRQIDMKNINVNFPCYFAVVFISQHFYFECQPKVTVLLVYIFTF
jgi:hypothetical protein